MIRDAQLKEYLNQQREIKHQEAVIEKLRSFNREKINQTRGKQGKNALQNHTCRKDPQKRQERCTLHWNLPKSVEMTF